MQVLASISATWGAQSYFYVSLCNIITNLNNLKMFQLFLDIYCSWDRKKYYFVKNTVALLNVNMFGNKTFRRLWKQCQSVLKCSWRLCESINVMRIRKRWLEANCKGIWSPLWIVNPRWLWWRRFVHSMAFKRSEIQKDSLTISNLRFYLS